ncbi:MAG: FtsX-like permease family protein [Cyclobacteriaceae bacterium]
MNPDPNKLPPQLAQRFLRCFLRDELAEEVEGDLEEKFYQTLEEHSLSRAKRNYWYQVFHYLRPFAIRNLTAFYNLTHCAMYQSYVKIGWRNLRKQKTYSLIKIGGLALGITACLLITLFIQDELRYDQHYSDGDRIYRVIGVLNDQGEILKGIHFPAPMASVLKGDFPEIETTGRINASELFGAGGREVRRADKAENVYEEGFVYVDQELLDMLQLNFVQGERLRALAEPNTIAISQSQANKLFPDEDPLGQTLVLGNDENQLYKVGGVFEDFPTTSHFQYDFLITMTGREFWPGEQTFWGASNYHTYIRVQPGTEADLLEAKLTKGVIQNYVLPSFQESGMVDAEAFASNLSIELQPIGDVHLYSAGIEDHLRHGDIRFVWLFGAIAGFILLIAVINFVNLSTAKSANRAKEVGLRKAIGSARRQLVYQFLTESLLISFLSFVLAMLLAFFLLPYFNDLSAKTLTFPWQAWWFLPVLVVVAIVIGVLAGLYPSVYLSRFKPAQVLKGEVSRGSKSSKLRSALVIFQFTTSIILIISTAIVYQQMQFILTKDVGFDKEQVILLQGANTLDQQLPTFKNELLQLSDVKQVSVSDYLPITDTKRNGNTFWKEGKVTEDVGVGGQIWRTDEDYLETMGMNIIEGRNFNVEMASDSQAVIINQQMAQELGLDDPVGQEITNSRATWQVIGVVKDFHFESLTEEIRPLCFELGNSPSVVSVKVNTTDMREVLDAVTAVWNRFSPNQTIRYTFLDESFAMMYADVQRMGRIFTSFAILAIVIACLGLFALSAFMAEQRRKEVSIRLVLGASFGQLFRLLTQNYLILIVISLIIAIPIAWYFMQRWLEDYEYRIPIQWDVFALAGLMAIAIAVLTVSYQSIRAALVNPADNLRSE